MIETAGVPGSCFYKRGSLGAKQVRFMFAKRDETLHEARRRLVRLRGQLAA